VKMSLGKRLWTRRKTDRGKKRTCFFYRRTKHNSLIAQTGARGSGKGKELCNIERETDSTLNIVKPAAVLMTH
jgi:hypothetical protein